MSEALKKLQEKCGCTINGVFSPETAISIMKHYNLSTEQAAHLIGQVIHESSSFKNVRENLNYSTSTLMRIWPSRFPTPESAKPYEYNPEALANKVYSNRMGNGNDEGYMYIGRGFLQLTGKNNYRAFANYMNNHEILSNPSVVETEYAMDTAIWFFNENGLFKIADEGVTDDVIRKITKRINGGYNGLDSRIKSTREVYGWLTA